MRRSSGRRTAPVAAAVLAVAALAVGCRPVTVTRTGAPDSKGVRYAPTTPAPPPLTARTAPAARHTAPARPPRTGHPAPRARAR
ncbi:hypothetical protein [Streptomyces endophytica]|uniref:Uncharacterized protein n=1 Tax=Streptomyces endophytica TaxID=2991496 RepID=A0ABY6P8G6_9ACTN|nr:hypothetical protein [Streptomyces endophytica]UZJ29898.1 hypothetical protein OJ254_04935 [Streptomyces endophytica]